MFSRVLAALTAAALLSLTACSGSDEPAASEGDSPAYADNAGADGAEQFIGYWADTLNEATTTGDTEQLKSLASDECSACTDFASQLDQIYAAGGRVESEGWSVAKVVPEKGATDDEVGLLVTFAVAPQKLYESEDAKAQTFDGGNQGFRFNLVREDGDWQVLQLSPR